MLLHVLGPEILLSEISRATCRRFKNTIDRLPSNITKHFPDYRGMDLDDLIAETQRKALPRMKNATQAGANYRAYALSNDASALAQANESANAATSLKREILAARFIIADSSLAAGCLDIADEAYKKIIISYSSSEEAGIRDRAKVGIDEIRDKRMRPSR
jgi:hypothetical protein